MDAAKIAHGTVRSRIVPLRAVVVVVFLPSETCGRRRGRAHTGPERRNACQSGGSSARHLTARRETRQAASRCWERGGVREKGVAEREGGRGGGILILRGFKFVDGRVGSGPIGCVVRWAGMGGEREPHPGSADPARSRSRDLGESGVAGEGLRAGEVDPTEGLALLRQEAWTRSGCRRGLAKVEAKRSEEGLSALGGS